MPTKKKSSENKEDQLSQLISLKKRERPSEEFWKGFEQELRSKQLTALVKTQSWYGRLGRLSLILGRKSIAVAATAGTLALAFFAVPQMVQVSSTDDLQKEILDLSEIAQQPAKPVFIVDESTRETESSIVGETFPQIDGAAIYRVNVMSQPESPERFTLVATPKTFTLEDNSIPTQKEIADKFGPKIIRAGQQF